MIYETCTLSGYLTNSMRETKLPEFSAVRTCFREKGMVYILSHYGVGDETWVNCSEKSKMTSNLSFVMIQKPYRKPCSAV